MKMCRVDAKALARTHTHNTLHIVYNQLRKLCEETLNTIFENSVDLHSEYQLWTKEDE